MRRINSLGRIPSLVLDDGETRAMTRSRCGVWRRSVRRLIDLRRL